MITIQTQSDGVLFNFQDSTRYLYGDGSILTPYNSLTLIADESNVLTFRKSASNDIFITAGYDELGYSSKEEAINDLKTKLFKATGGTGSGVLVINLDDLTNNMTDDKWDELANALENDIPIFSVIDASGEGTTDIQQFPVNGMLMIDENEGTSEITLYQLFGGGYYEIHIQKNGSEDYTITNDWHFVPNELSAGTGIDITDNVISVTGGSSVTVDPTLDTGSTNPVANSAITTAIDGKQDALEYYEENTEDGYADIYITNDDGQGNVNEYSFNIGGGSADLGHYSQYDDGQGNSGYTNTTITLNNPEIIMYAESEENGTTEVTTLTIYPTGVTINDDAVVTESQLDDYQPVLSAGTGIDITDNVISVTGGSSVTVDPTLDSGSTNPVANSAITTAIDTKAELSNTVTDVRVYDTLFGRELQKKVGNGGYSTILYYGKINNTNIINEDYITNFQLVEKSSITSAITSASTNAEVAGAKAVYDAIQAAGGGGGGSVTVDSYLDIQSTNPVENQAIAQAIDDTNAVVDTKADQSELYELLGGSNDEMDPVTPIRFQRISQSDYDDLLDMGTTDPDTVYIITPDEPDEENEGDR